MARPIYETQADRDGENAIADKLKAAYGGTFSKLPRHYGSDFGRYGEDGELAAFVEMKDRSARFRWSDFVRQGGYKISLGKWVNIANFTKLLEVPLWLVIKCADGLYLGQFRPDKVFGVPVKEGGRRDRGDWQDLEPMISLDPAQFVKVA